MVTKEIRGANPHEIASRYRLREDLSLLFDARTGQYHRLNNATSRWMYQLALAGAARDEIVATISARYRVDPERVADDVDEFFDVLDSVRYESIGQRHHTEGIDKGFDSLLNFPLRLELELTAVCNWNCGFCYNVWKIDPELSDRDVRRQIRELPAKHLPMQTARTVLDECAEKGCYVVRYSGGETLLHPEAMDILEYGGELGLYQVVFTNGHFVSDDVAKRMAAANVRCALVSMHGDRQTHNRLAGHKQAYDRAIAAMKRLRAVGIDVVAEMTLVQENVDGVLDVIRDVYSIGVRDFGIMRYVPTGKDDEKYGVPVTLTMPLMEEIDRLIRIECPDATVGWPCGQKFCTSSDDAPLRADDPSLALRFSQLAGHCESGLVWGSISFDGQLRNCPHSNVYFGHVDEGVAAGWEVMTSAVARAVKPRETCAGCAVADACRGGCHLSQFLAVKEPSKLLPLFPVG